MLRAVCRAEDVADVVCTIDFVYPMQCLRKPHADDWVACAREQQRGVRAEEEREDTALVRLDLVHLLEGGKRPCDNFSVLCASKDAAMVVAHDEGEDRAVMFEAVDKLRLLSWTLGSVDGTEDRGRDGKRGC